MATLAAGNVRHFTQFMPLKYCVERVRCGTNRTAAVPVRARTLYYTVDYVPRTRTRTLARTLYCSRDTCLALTVVKVSALSRWNYNEFITLLSAITYDIERCTLTRVKRISESDYQTCK